MSDYEGDLLVMGWIIAVMLFCVADYLFIYRPAMKWIREENRNSRERNEATDVCNRGKKR